MHLREVRRQDSSGFTLYTHLYTEYDLSGHLLSEQLIGDLGSVAFTIDPLGRTSGISSVFFSQNVLEYDPVGNITQLQTLEETAVYAYDDLYQLTRETGPVAHTYAYDSHYNRLEKDGERHELNALNQHPLYTYDPDGNPIACGNTRYSYDALDRLISVETPHLRLTFTYDSFHRRLSKTTSRLIDQSWQTEQLFFFYDGQNEIGAINASGTIVQLRILGSTPNAEIGAAVACELEGKTFAPIHDLSGNVASLISLEDHTQETYRYDAFGNPAASSIFHNPWTFSSKRFDEETGLIYYGRRYFDPLLGRWLTPDPLGFEEGMNLYAFVQNNPLVTLDPYGLFVQPLSVTTPMVITLMVITPMVKTPMISPEKVAPMQIAITPVTTPYIPGPLTDSPRRPLLKNFSVAALEGAGHSALAASGTISSLGQIMTAPFYFLVGHWNHWKEDWNDLQASNAYYHFTWQQQMVALLPPQQRAEYYEALVATSQSIADGALLGLTLGSAALPKGAQAFQLAAKEQVQLNRFHQAASELSEVGQNNIRALRGWAKSKGWEKLPNPNGGPEKWGIFNNGEFEWALRIKPEASMRKGLEAGSRQARFVARLRSDGNSYINPFTGKVGKKDIGAHIPLE